MQRIPCWDYLSNLDLAWTLTVRLIYLQTHFDWFICKLPQIPLGFISECAGIVPEELFLMSHLLFAYAKFPLWFFRNQSSYFDFLHSSSGNPLLKLHYFSFVIALCFSFRWSIVSALSWPRFNPSKKNLNSISDFQQIKTFLEKVFGYLPSTGALPKSADSPQSGDLSKIGILFSWGTFALQNFYVAIEERSSWLLLSSHHIKVKLHSAF